MKTRRIILSLIFFAAFFKGFAQAPIPMLPVYTDPATGAATAAELAALKTLEGVKNQVSSKWNSTMLTSIAERMGRTNLSSPTRQVHFVRYANMCDNYLNPVKKKKCNQKLDYLMEAHDALFELLQVRTMKKVRKGIEDQIWERYASISVFMIGELESMHRDVKKTMKYKLLKR